MWDLLLFGRKWDHKAEHSLCHSVRPKLIGLNARKVGFVAEAAGYRSGRDAGGVLTSAPHASNPTASGQSMGRREGRRGGDATGKAVELDNGGKIAKAAAAGAG
jgi:hypothetical protein